MSTPPPSLPEPPVLVGLGEGQAAMTAEEFFSAFSWEPLLLDPERMTAEEFLSSL